MSTCLKLSFNNELHRVSNRPQSLNLLLKAVKEVFPELSTASDEKRVSLKYQDSEGDMIVIATEDDYQTALVSSDSERKSLKVVVTEEAGVSSSFILSALPVESENKEIDNKYEVVIQEEKIEPQPAVEVQAEKVEEPDVHEQKELFKEKCLRFKHHHHHHREHKLNKLKELTRQTLQEELPTIAMIVKQMIEDPNAKVQPQPQPQPQQNLNKPVHRGIGCDVCKVVPIVGVRYKCTVLYDYDLCENCEAKVDHPYPLLKLKNEAQRNMKVSVVLNDFSGPHHRPHHGQHPHHFGHHNHHRHGENLGFRKCHPKPEDSSEKKKEEARTRCQGLKKMRDAYLKHMNKPEQTEHISKDWKGGFREFLNAFKGIVPEFEQVIRPQQPQEEVKQEVPKNETVVEETNSTNVSEKKNEIEEKPLKESENDSSVLEKLPENPEAEKAGVIENKQVVENNEVEIKEEKYSPEVTTKAKVILDIFPQLKLEDVCEVITQSPNKSVEELVQDFLASF